MRQIPLLLLCMASLLAAAVPAHAAKAGDLDPSFSGDGRQTTTFGGRDGFGPQVSGSATAIGPDGKIVVVGDSSIPRDIDPGNDGEITRYNRDGSLDRTFSGNGKGSLGVDASDVAIQPDGKIVVTGREEVSNSESRTDTDFRALRLDANGTPDRTFSGTGSARVDFGGNDDTASRLVLDSQGRIVLAGTTRDVSRDFAVARLKPDGSLDSTFSGDGRETIDFGGQDNAAAVALDLAGRIVLAGTAQPDFALARLTQVGTLDPTFSGDGKETTDLRGSGDATGDLAIQRNGRIVVAGTSGRAGGRDFALARYNPSGGLDRSFSGDGKRFIDFGRYSRANGIALQRDGKIVVAGHSGHSCCARSRFVLARLDTRGGLDRSFSDDGKVITAFADGAGANDVAVQRDGKIVVVGTNGVDFVLARYFGAGDSQPGPRPKCTVTGSPRGDVLFGTPGDDVICAGAGNDVVRAGGGNDTVYGGPGNDVLRGEGGSDRLYGQGGNDALEASDGKRGNDLADGGEGNDACSRDPGDRRRSCS